MNKPTPVETVTLTQDLTLPALLQQRAESHPDLAFAHEVNGTSRTYQQMHEASLAFAAYFAEKGVEREEIVATFMPATLEALELWVGLSWLGAIEAALNTAYRHQLLADVVNDTRASTIVTTTEFLPHLVEAAGSLVHVAVVHVLDVDDQSALPKVDGWAVTAAAHARSTPPARKHTRPEMHESSCILYTSGTTGPSKGVLLPWAQMLESGRTIIPTHAMTSDDIFYCPYAPCHITGKAYFYSMLLVGGGYVVKRKFSTSEFWPDIRAFGCTTTLLQGAMAHFLLNRPARDDDAENPLTQVIVAPVIQEVDELERRFGMKVGTVYNMTELSCPLVSEGWNQDGPGSCGIARDGVEVRVADELDRELPVGEVGELLVRHRDPWTLTTGYLGRPEATVSAMRNNWFHTGDAFYRTEDGRYFFVDRIKDSIRRRGENISSSEVEREVRKFPGVKECAAIAAPSEFGEDDVRIAVVPEDVAVVSPAELYNFLVSRLAAYMLPRYIDVIDSIPKTETQKIQKNLLRALPIGDATWEAPDPRALA
ncbi:AMP-binding protein [Microbacterium alcoholitolerans]|uniref:AMP-binding protein n=1 Tax=unclassified Microbacterium TaxID=2609290 RepID=UPI003D169913